MSKDYRVEIKVRNNLLYKAMYDNGYSNGAELSRAAGVTVGNVCNALNLAIPLYSGVSGEINNIWIKLSEVLRMLPEDLVPETHHYKGLKKNKAAIELAAEEVACLVQDNPHQDMLVSEVKDKVSKALMMLSSREERVIRMRWGLGDMGEETTLQAIGDEFGVNKERIRQVEARAIRKLRHPSRGLRELMEEE